MSTPDYAVISPNQEYQKSHNHLVIFTMIITIITIILWIATGFTVITFFLSFVSIISFIYIIRRLNQLEKSLSILSASIETKTRSSNEIISFEDVIHVKLQYEQYVPGYFVFHPITLILSILNSVQEKDSLSTRLFYEIETEEYVISDQIESVDYDAVNLFIEMFNQYTAIKPHVKDYETFEGRGSIFYFSFRERHSDLNPGEASGLT